MTDLTATNCGCGCEANTTNGFGCSSIIWIILLLSCCGNGNSGIFGGNRNNDCGGDCMWLILILLFCGNGNNGFGCC